MFSILCDAIDYGGYPKAIKHDTLSNGQTFCLVSAGEKDDDTSWDGCSTVLSSLQAFAPESTMPTRRESAAIAAFRQIIRKMGRNPAGLRPILQRGICGSRCTAYAFGQPSQHPPLVASVQLLPPRWSVL